MKANYIITQNKFNAILNQETTEIKVSFKTGYYPLPYALDNYYTKNETDLLLENYYLKTETYSKNEVNYFLNSKADSSQLNNYYTKSETYSQSQINTYLSTKLDKGTYTGTASDLKSDIDGKLNKPTTTSTTASYPFVVGEDGNGNSARLPAGDLGKNFFNSDLNNTTARNHTMNAGVTVNTLGNPHT